MNHGFKHFLDQFFPCSVSPNAGNTWMMSLSNAKKLLKMLLKSKTSTGW